MIRVKTIYYQDELNDEFSDAVIIPRKIDENYQYIEQRSLLWNVSSYVLQNIISILPKILYAKLKFKIKYIGKEKLKINKKVGYFMYVNHTQPFADTFLPSIANFPKRNFFIVNPENVSMKHLESFVEKMGAIPIPGNKEAMKNFLHTVKARIKKKSSITIYPEAHIWPYYTKIRPFKDVSFKYPIELNTPTYCLTNTYQSYGRKKNKVKIVTYIDGPFYPNPYLTKKEQQKDLRDKVYARMVERSKNNNIEVIQYVYKEKNKEELNV